ncbi:OmpA family protein [Parvicella tangerina]|uniref:Peptidoglycan-associated lipoprotein n=1 Tax=Parvicella tangerina TaxID=2829795 RepID=A0A916JL58_9FLAO|nr:OmpA family protein [Parvicella tangerina]CAG5078243.1 Peptidoglycan-associated lipoprotein [Parvicella tangerina]
MKLRNLLFALLILLGGVGYCQLSYEHYKEAYKPHYDVLVKNYTPVETFNDLNSGQYGAALIYLYDESLKNKDLQTNISGILTSADRSKVAQGLKECGASYAIKVLGLMKDEWQQEIAWFLDRETYHAIAPSLPAIRDFKPGSAGYLFKKEVKNFGLLYAGGGLDLAYSAFKGLSTYVDAYNGWTTKVGPGGTLYTLSEELNSPGGFKGFTLGAGLKLSNTMYMDIYFQRRATVASGGGESPEAWTKDIKFSMNNINLDFMWMQQPQFISFVQGFGFQYNMGGVKHRSSLTDNKYEKIGDNVSNFGVKYKAGLMINPESLPVMFGVTPYWQINFPKMDFTSVDEANPQLAYGGGDVDDLKSSVSNLGIQLTVNYKFGGKQEVKDYPTFEEELMATMDPHLNTTYEELLPRITPDGKTLYFVRGDHPLNVEGASNTQDIWVSSDIDKGLDKATAKHLGAPFNEGNYNAVVGVSPDENSMVIKGYYKNGEPDGIGYSIIYRTKDGWSKPEGLDIKDYKSMAKGSYVGAYWTQDGKKMILSLSESSTDDLQDMYISELQADGSWSKPKNLGPDINTDAGEHSPFLASDGKTLYFSSNREGGEGGYDIYFTQRMDDSWTKWSEPVNMGSEINSENFDAYYTIDAKGEYAYMVSSENSVGLTDIVRIELEQEVQPDPVVLITGKVLNAKDNSPLEANIAYNGLLDGVNYGIARTNPATGEYKIVLPYGKKYDFSANAANFIGISETMDLTEVGEYKEIVRDLYLVPIEVGSTVRLNNIFFETGKSELKDESYNELNRVVELLNQNPAMTIELSGHTDNVGNAASNKKLSQDRAASCKTYLVEQGIDESRLKAVGYGEDKPVASNDTAEGQAQNRRVEFTILTN